MAPHFQDLQQCSDDEPWSLVVVQFRCCAERLREAGINVVAIDEPDWKVSLPAGGTVLLVGPIAQRLAGDIKRLGVATCYAWDVPPGYRWPSELLEDRAAAAKYQLAAGDEIELWRALAGNATVLHDVEPTGHPGMANRASAPRAISVLDIVNRWVTEGPLQRVRTGLATLDALTGGGPAFGCVFVVNGAPDAGKTAFVAQITDECLSHEITVGMLAVDADPDDITTRFLQRRSVTRRQCEERDSADLATMREKAAALSLLRLYDQIWTIEATAADVAAAASARGGRGVLVVDSIQTVRSALEDGRESRYEVVTMRMNALRAVAAQYGLLVIVTSEMNRGGYKSAVAGERVSDMAASSGSGAIEYGARLGVSLRNVEGEPDLIELRVFKNKFGPRHRDDERGIHLRIDRARQMLAQDNDYRAPTGDDIDEGRVEKREQKLITDAAGIAVMLASHPGQQSKDFLRLVRGATKGGMGQDRYDIARGRLAQAVVELPGERTAVLLYLNGGAVPAEVLEAIAIGDRGVVSASRPPAAPEPPRAPTRSEPLGAPRSASKAASLRERGGALRSKGATLSRAASLTPPSEAGAAAPEPERVPRGPEGDQVPAVPVDGRRAE